MPSRYHTHTEVVPSAQELINVACELITAAAAISIGRRGCFRLALAGGSTPQPIYAALAADRDIDWRRWQLFWSDERTVPPDHPESNYGMVKSALLEKLAVKPGIVMRMRGESEPAAAAADYENVVRELVPANYDATTGVRPRFDMILLGMGADGHTASLFPHTAALGERERLVVANVVPQAETTRLTFTAPLINASRRVLFLVSGAGKAQALRNVLSGPSRPEAWPSQLIRPAAGNLVWLVDEPAFATVEAELSGEKA